MGADWLRHRGERGAVTRGLAALGVELGLACLRGLAPTAGAVALILSMVPAAGAAGAEPVVAQPPAPLAQTPIQVPLGFAVERVYTVPPDQGSWVAMAVDPLGRLIASDQFGRLYRLALPDLAGAKPAVEVLTAEVGSAQGLWWAADSLYVVANRSVEAGGSGLYRLRFGEGGERIESVELVRSLEGSGEHGPHAIIAGPDGRSLYILAGNATSLPSLERSRVPRLWAEDTLWPHLGQTDGVFRSDRPGGWIARLDPDAGCFELVAMGLRNPYDLAFNADGELFTFDADMEWDLGTPWYRPTRVIHVTSGADFGWRTGSSKWPDHYPDSQPAVLDVGESSPTGLTFGYGARFPARYQRALLLGDWSYGKIYALHLDPVGASYQGTLESFVSGAPLPVTDLAIRPQDGALYFLTGGRQTTSSLLRVRYQGPESTAPVGGATPDPEGLRARRRALEEYHGRCEPGAIAALWPALGHADRAIRYAARVALEHQPVGAWQERALAERDPRRQLTALVALSRCAGPGQRAALLGALGRFEWRQLGRTEQLDLLRIYALVCLRLGRIEEDERQAILDCLDPLFPTGTYDLDRELSQVLIYLRAPGIVARALMGMATALSQEEQIHYALGLRTLDPNGWMASQRERYFEWFARARAWGGGVTYNEYLHGIRSEAIEQLDPLHHDQLRPILARPPPADPYVDLEQRSLVRAWTVEELLPDVDGLGAGRDFERGRRVFSTAMCLKCHRFNRQGGLTGPDLTGVARRFDNRMLLESMIDPSRVVSDQYATVTVWMKDGESYTGRIGDHTESEVLLKGDLLNPANLQRLRVQDIESVRPSSLSLMPSGLLDAFTLEEILDLLAYLKSQGDPGTRWYRAP
ncbi:MAG: c-type cytochrome [Verrucomicrobia bacterium]|nr:c-type cytochrome [Verrucomicrobiota bacterium]